MVIGYNRLKRMDVDATGIAALVHQAEASLFQSIHLNPAHVHLLPPTVRHANGLCPRPHKYVLPPKNFIPRHLEAYKLTSKALPSLTTPLLTQRSVSH